MPPHRLSLSLLRQEEEEQQEKMVARELADRMIIICSQLAAEKQEIGHTLATERKWNWK